MVSVFSLFFSGLILENTKLREFFGFETEAAEASVASAAIFFKSLSFRARNEPRFV